MSVSSSVGLFSGVVSVGFSGSRAPGAAASAALSALLPLVPSGVRVSVVLVGWWWSSFVLLLLLLGLLLLWLVCFLLARSPVFLSVRCVGAVLGLVFPFLALWLLFLLSLVSVPVFGRLSS